MKLFHIILSTLLFFSFLNFLQADELPYLDSDFECISKKEANQFVKDFNIRVKSFGGLELCNASVDTKKLFNDFQVVKQGRFSGNETNVFIKNWVPQQNYYNWLISTTRSIRRANNYPGAIAYNSSGHFTMQDGWARLTALGRVGVLVHEGRHTNGYRHYSCKYGPYKNVAVSGCDTSLNQGGSHAVEMEYYSRVALRGENFHPVYKALARLSNLARANFVFNRPVITANETLLATSLTENKLIAHNSESHYDLPVLESLENTILKRTSFGATLINDGKTFAIDIYSMLNSGVSIEDNYSYYKLFKMTKKLKFVDAEEFDINQLRIFVGLTAEGKIYRYNYSRSRWDKIATVQGGERFETQLPEVERASGLFLITDKNEIHSFDLNSNSFRKLGAQWPENILSTAWFENQTLLLDSDGVVKKISGEVYEPFSEKRLSQLISVPFYEDFSR